MRLRSVLSKTACKNAGKAMDEDVDVYVSEIEVDEEYDFGEEGEEDDPMFDAMVGEFAAECDESAGVC